MLNMCAFQGRLCRDPELRRTNSGKAVTSFTLAVDDDFKGEDGQKTTTFVDCVAWGTLAETVAKYFAKGQMAIAAGRLKFRDWTDKDGNKRRATEIIVNNVYFCEKKEGGTQVAPAYGSTSYDTHSGEFVQISEDETLPF